MKYFLKVALKNSRKSNTDYQINIIKQIMKSSIIVLTLALAAVSLCGVLQAETLNDTPNPNDIFKQVQFKPLNPLSYAEPEVEVDLTLLSFGYHSIALLKVRTLYPSFTGLGITRCRYSALGLVRFYTFTFGSTQEARCAIDIEDNQETKPAEEDDNDGFLRISVEWAQQDPRISFALNSIIRRNWNVIAGNPLFSCWSKPFGGLFTYRFYFTGVAGRFEFVEEDNKTVGVQAKDYFADVAPVFTVAEPGDAKQYLDILSEEFAKNPAFSTISQLLEKEFGKFDKNWIIKVQGVIAKDPTSSTFKIFVNFKPFLLQCTYEAYYYGSIEKAALLKLDERVFSEGRSFENWQNIDEFNKYHAFTEAHTYVLSQFTWMRFYKVVSAYSSLHMKGRFVRLVYQGLPEHNIDAENQINIIVYIDECGKYYIERNDFLATSLGSYGRNNWVSLFVKTPDVTKAEYYQRIVKFYKAIYPKFWSDNQLVDIQFKEGLHVIKFKNPTNLCYSVLNFKETETQVLNRFNWTLLEGESPLVGRIENFVRAKYSVSKLMFIQFYKSDNGTHFEVSYLDKENQYRAAYVLYIETTDVFCDDQYFHFQGLTYAKDPLPADVKASLSAFLLEQEETCLAVASFVSLSPTSFAIIAVSETGRWQITVNWQDGKWVVVSKQPYTEGYFRAQGYPSSSVASCTGFLTKLYPVYFGKAWIYASIETKTVGVNMFTRIVYQFGVSFAEAIVGQTYGVVSSHVLYSWRLFEAIRTRPDYGYGRSYNYFYDADKSYFYDQPVPKPNLSVQPVTAFREVHMHDSCPPYTRRQIFTGQCLVVF